MSGREGVTPEVTEWLAKTNNLQLAAISISGNPTIDADTHMMMRMIMTACQSLMSALRNLPPVGFTPPPPEETQ
jgi:hypothetical protein